jgi:hypothetical protein
MLYLRQGSFLHAVQSCIRNSDAEDDEGCCWQVDVEADSGLHGSRADLEAQEHVLNSY